MIGTYFSWTWSLFTPVIFFVASHATSLVLYVDAGRRYSRLMLAYQMLIIVNAFISRISYSVIHLLEVKLSINDSFITRSTSSTRFWLLYKCDISTKTPITGRTHQLRVHCAAMGHPILGDPAYGFDGEAHPNGGFSDDTMSTLSPTCASFELRRAVEDAVRDNGRTMCLHARQLKLQHPITNEEVLFEASPLFWGDSTIKTIAFRGI